MALAFDDNGEPIKPKLTKPEDQKLTKDVQDKICGALEGNQFMSTAAALAGVGINTVYVWLRKGATGEEPYATFRQEVERAMAVAEGLLVKSVSRSAEHNTADAKWLLERRHGDRGWRKTDKVEVGGDPSQPITVQLAWPGQAQPDELPAADDPNVIDAEVVEDSADADSGTAEPSS